jgi:signal transduction histidine kinase
MKRSDALELLHSPDSHLRLKAARYFSRFAAHGDRQEIQAALATEDVVWIRAALTRALETSSSRAVDPPRMEARYEVAEESDVVDDVYAQAIEETTRKLVHEIEPILGIARLCAQKEIKDYQGSKTKQQLDRLATVLRAIDTLSRAASAPIIEEFDLSDLVRSIAESEYPVQEIGVDLAGPKPMVVVADKALIEIALVNGLRNALEATRAFLKISSLETARTPKVTVSWGETDRDYWLTVLDRGIGLPHGLDRVWDMGLTTKEDHLGMGLAIAQRAVLSLRGKILLNPRADGGAAYEFRWPKGESATL